MCAWRKLLHLIKLHLAASSQCHPWCRVKYCKDIHSYKLMTLPQHQHCWVFKPTTTNKSTPYQLTMETWHQLLVNNHSSPNSGLNHFERIQFTHKTGDLQVTNDFDYKVNIWNNICGVSPPVLSSLKCSTFWSTSLHLQDIWGSDHGCQAEVAVLLEWHSGLVQFAVSSLHPVSVLRLHVPCHYIWRPAWGGNTRQHSESEGLALVPFHAEL